MLSELLIFLQYRFYISKITSKCCADTTYITKEFCQDWSKRVKPQRHLDCQPDILRCSDGLTHTVSFNVSSVSANVAFHQKSDITLTLQCSPACPHMTVTDVRSCKWLVFYGGDDFVGLVAPLVSPHHADWSTCLFVLFWHGWTAPRSSEVSFDLLFSGFWTFDCKWFTQRTVRCCMGFRLDVFGFTLCSYHSVVPC